MPLTTQLLDAFRATDPATALTYAAIGAAIGALLMPLVVFLAIKTNYRKMRDMYAATLIPQTARFYRLFAIAGAALFAIIAASQPVLDAAGDNEVWIRGALIPVILIVIGIPFVRALRRLQRRRIRPPPKPGHSAQPSMPRHFRPKRQIQVVLNVACGLAPIRAMAIGPGMAVCI